jgi:hypothetical protein
MIEAESFNNIQYSPDLRGAETILPTHNLIISGHHRTG